MKNIRRFASLAVAVLVCLSMVLLMVACGDEGSTTGSSTETQSSATQDSTGTQDSTQDSSNTQSSVAGSTTTDSSKTDDDGKDEVNPNLVTVTVLNQLGKPVNGAIVQICQGENCFAKPITTGADGTGSREYTLGEGTLKAKILSINGMDDYLEPAELGYVYFEEGSRELTITVQKITVNVFDDGEMGIEGAEVQLYQGEHEFKSTIMTDADGMAYGYVALDGNEISAKVTNILSGDKYEISKDAQSFGYGEYEGTIIVKKNAVYTVKLSTMFKEAIADAKVTLYKDGKISDMGKTDANGIIKFEGSGDGEYSVGISIVSPAYQPIGASEDGKFYFTNGSTTLDISVVTLDEITYTVKVLNGQIGQTVSLYDTDNFLVASAQTDETGTAKFTAPNGNYTAVLEAEDGKYAAPVYFVTDDSASGEIEVTTKTAGQSKDNPIILVGNKQLTLTAEQTVWFAIPNGYRKVLSVTSGVVVNYNGNQLNDNGIIIELELEEAKGEISYFSVTAQSEKTIDVSVSAPGTKNEPVDITENVISKGTHQIDAFGVGDLTVYYSFTANRDGTVSVTVDTSYYSVLFNGVAGYAQDGDFLYPLSAGETVSIAIIGNFLEDGDDTGIFTFYFGEERVDYTVTVSKDGEAAQGIVVILSTKDGKEIARGTTTENGQYVFEDVAYLNNYVVKVEYPEGYTSTHEQNELGASVAGLVVLTSIKTGEPDAPYEFDTQEGTETAEVKENGTVWYTLNIRESYDGTTYTIYANSANAVIKIYNSDTNGDGVIDSDDTPIGTSAVNGGKASYTFGANNVLYTIAVSTSDGAAESIVLEYVSSEAEEGSSTSNAIEVIEAGTYTASVDGDVYYRFAGERCKLTVTLTGSANLQTVELSMDGIAITDTEGNTFTVEDTEGDWIYFVISSDVAGEYQFTVTVE